MRPAELDLRRAWTILAGANSFVRPGTGRVVIVGPTPGRPPWWGNAWRWAQRETQRAGLRRSFAVRRRGGRWWAAPNDLPKSGSAAPPHTLIFVGPARIRGRGMAAIVPVIWLVAAQTGHVFFRLNLVRGQLGRCVFPLPGGRQRRLSGVLGGNPATRGPTGAGGKVPEAGALKKWPKADPSIAPLEACPRPRHRQRSG